MYVWFSWHVIFKIVIASVKKLHKHLNVWLFFTIRKVCVDLGQAALASAWAAAG